MITKKELKENVDFNLDEITPEIEYALEEYLDNLVEYINKKENDKN